MSRTQTVEFMKHFPSRLWVGSAKGVGVGQHKIITKVIGRFGDEEDKYKSPQSAGKVCLKNRRGASPPVWPLVFAFTLLAVVTSEATRSARPRRRKSADEEQVATLPSTPLMILNTTI